MKETAPEFIRIPKKTCPYTGLSRSYLCRLILPSVDNKNQPPVRSHVLKKPGLMRGVRLIDFASLIAFIRSQPADLTSP